MTDVTTLHAIANLVPHGARVLDLGCGDGAMLDYLQRERGCTGYGVELDDANVLACVQRGVNVLQLSWVSGRLVAWLGGPDAPPTSAEHLHASLQATRAPELRPPVSPRRVAPRLPRRARWLPRRRRASPRTKTRRRRGPRAWTPSRNSWSTNGPSKRAPGRSSPSPWRCSSRRLRR